MKQNPSTMMNVLEVSPTHHSLEFNVQPSSVSFAHHFRPTPTARNLTRPVSSNLAVKGRNNRHFNTVQANL